MGHRIALEIRHEVRVRVQGNGDRGMAHCLLHDLWMHAMDQGQGSEGVAKLLERATRNLRIIARSVEAAL